MVNNVILLPIVKPILNIPLPIPPSRRGQGLEAGPTNVPSSISPPRKGPRLYDLVMEEASRIGTFFTCLDFEKFSAIFGSDFPKEFNPERFKNIVMEAFQAPKASISKGEAQVLINAKLGLEKCLRYMHRMFGLFATAGFYNDDVLESLAWLSKMNQDSYLELTARLKTPTSRDYANGSLLTGFEKRIVEYSKTCTRTPLNVQTAREMAAQRSQAGDKFKDNETPLYSNPDPLLKYRHPQWNV